MSRCASGPVRRSAQAHRFVQWEATGCSCISSKRTRYIFQSSWVGISAFDQTDPAKNVNDSPECRLKIISALFPSVVVLACWAGTDTKPVAILPADGFCGVSHTAAMLLPVGKVG